MTLASLHRISLCALACAATALARTAAAEGPSNLPPVPGPAPKPPGPPVIVPGSATPPGLAWMAPSYTPPGPGSVAPSATPPGYGLPYQLPGYPAPSYPASGYYGSQYFQTSYVLPEPLPRRRRDTGLFVGGVIAVAGGMAAVLVGAYLVSSAAGAIDIYCDTPSFPCAHKTDAVRLTGGAILMAGGTALGIAGIPMWLVGSQYVTLPRGDKKAALRPDVRVGVGSASLTWRF